VVSITSIIILLVIAISLLILLILTFLGTHVYRQAHKPPDITPEKFLKDRMDENKKKAIVCIGDSITHGRVSANYVEILQDKYSNDCIFVNAGINSNLAWNVLNRLDKIIECNPYIVTILIGTNDANATISKKLKKDYIKRMKLPREPDKLWFKESLTEVINQLQTKTQAKIALLTLPTIGEELESKYFNLSCEYSHLITEIALEHGIECLPLHKKMVDYLTKNPANPKYPYEEGQKQMLWGITQHYLLRKSWDEISKNAGFKLHMDYLHLNSYGATMITSLISDFIDSQTSGN
jgi:lysophospholipase L1-like esterase